MSLKSFFKDICKDLPNWKDTLKKFESLDDDGERFATAYQISRDYFFRLTLKSVSKCNEKSATCRREGNDLFKKGSYWKALNLYNKSIAFARGDSEELSFAYGNRASCLLRLRFPKEALADVECALSICRSNEFREKLLARKEQCLEAVNKPSGESGRAPFSSGNVPSLTGAPSSFFDSTADTVLLAQDEYWERKLVVGADVKAGDVLVVEEPYSSVLLPDHFYTHCSKCFGRCLRLVPCSTCPTAMFCGQDCLTKARHAIECSYLPILSQLNADRKELLSLKILIDASDEGQKLGNLYEEITKYDNRTSDTKTVSYRSLDFINIYDLVTNSKKRTPSDLFYRAIISAILVLLLEKHTTFFNSIPDNRRDSLIVFSGRLVLRFMQSLPCNAHEISEYNSTSLQEIGAGAYATLSLMNHSCDPNVVRFSCQDKIVVRAIKPMDKGEQIFDNYGYHYATHGAQERQSALEEQYYFRCQCQACAYRWPVLDVLVDLPMKLIWPPDMTIFNKLKDEFEVHVQNVLDGNITDSVIEWNVKYLNFIHNVVQLPWINYNRCQELIKHCLNFQSNYFKPSESEG